MFDLIQIIAAADPHAAMESVSIPEKFGIEMSQIGMQVFSFLVLTVVLWKYGFKPVFATLDERQEKIESGLQYAEEMKAKLADAESHHKEVVQKASLEAQTIVEDARKIADEKISKATQDAVKQAEEVIKKSEKQIEMDRKQMLEEARSEIARLVVATTAKVLSKDLSTDEKSRFSEAASANLVDSSN